MKSRARIVIFVLVTASGSAGRLQASDQWRVRVGGGIAESSASEENRTLGSLFEPGGGAVVTLERRLSPVFSIAAEAGGQRFPFRNDNAFVFLDRALGSGRVLGNSPATVLTLTLSARARTPKARSAVRPYVLAGVGATRVAYDYETREARFGGPEFRVRNVEYRDLAPSASAGVGSDFRLATSVDAWIEGRYHVASNAKEPILWWNLDYARYWTVFFGIAFSAGGGS